MDLDNNMDSKKLIKHEPIYPQCINSYNQTFDTGGSGKFYLQD